VKLVIVTSCPTGIAHSEMAAEALDVAAQERGHTTFVEVQGASGAPPVADHDIASADAVVLAIDAGLRDGDRFAGLPTVQVRTREAIDRAAEVIERAEAAVASAPARTAAPAASAATAAPAEPRESAASRARRHLMTGVSYMLPFVIGGGILIALGFAIGGAVEVTEIDVYENLQVGALFFKIGATAFSMLVPFLAGFIAYSMADRPGIAPGVVGGLLANEIGAGFLGGIVAGVLAGWIVNWLKRIPATGTLKRMLPILVYPVVGTLAVGALMIVVVGEPIAAATTGLENWLNGLSGTNEILLGIIIGGMMAFDMGGPVNKVAYGFGIAALDAGNFQIMAAIMAAGMTPPLGLALATVVRPALFNESEKRAGEAAWLMGASFITEGAIPFAAADPLRVIPSLMVGSAATASLSLAFNATLQAPHGGVFVVGLIGNALPYLLAIAIGTALTAVMVVLLKSVGREPSGSRTSTGAIDVTDSQVGAHA
jgi:PTS system fructose-specific IIC component